MDEKEKEFYRRIKRFRVDPSASSMANPVPGMFWVFNIYEQNRDSVYKF